MINLSDLKNFCVLLNDEKTNIIEKLQILKKLENWIPIKDYVVVSNIGKVLYKCSKLPGQIGLKSSSIVNKWKKLICNTKQIDSTVQISSENNVSRNKTDFNSVSQLKSKNISRKNQSDNIPIKKVCLSLNDYYKRKGIERPEDVNNHDLQANSSLNNEDNNELTSELGISFMDSFSIKPKHINKSRKGKLLNISDICSLTSAENISKRNDIVQSLPSLQTSRPIEENLTKRTVTSIKCWAPKVQKSHYISGKEPETLLKICQDVLLTYRNYIEEVYLTPRELLITVLENYSTEQLLKFESFNPHYIDDNDSLWEKHFQAKFPSRQRIDGESWREAFCNSTIRERARFETSVLNMKSKYEAEVKYNQQHAVKLINARRNPVSRKFYQNFQSFNSPYSRVTQKLQKQLRKQFSHLPF